MTAPNRKNPPKGSNIRKRFTPNGHERWERRWTDANGKDRQQTHLTLDAAIKAWTQHKADVESGRKADEDKGARTFAAYADRLLERKLLSDARPVTVAGYRRYLDKYAVPFLGKRKVSQIDSSVLLDFVDHLSSLRTGRTKANPEGYGLSPATIKHAFIPVRQVLALAVLDRAITINPAMGVPLPARNAAPRPVAFQWRPVTPEEVDAICCVLDERDPSGIDSLVTCFLANTGLRAAELAGLEVRDFSALNKTISVVRTKTLRKLAPKVWAFEVGAPKSKASVRTLRIADWLADDLSTYLATVHEDPANPSAAMFPGRLPAHLHQAHKDGTQPNPVHDWSKPIDAGTFLQRRFRPALAPAGVDPLVRLHDLRHSYGTELRKQGVPLDEICRMMGHSSLAFTHARYVHTDPASFITAANALRNPRAGRRPSPVTALVAAGD